MITSFLDGDGYCKDICGDGMMVDDTMVSSRRCDDDNINSGDGCTDVCYVEEDHYCES
jgi:cysteine-rich repeat protein